VLDVALTLRPAITLVGRPARRPSTETAPRVRLDRTVLFCPLPDRPAADLDPWQSTAVALLGGDGRFI
jgi:hypothetical protein